MKPKYLIAIIILTLSFSITLTSCKKVSRKNIEAVVERDIETFSPNEIPGSLKDAILDHKMVFLGRAPYMQEHQEYVCEILDLVKDQPVLFFHQSSQAFSWIVEDYLNGERDDLPDYIKATDQLLIEKIKTIKKTQVHDSLFQTCFIGLNKRKDNFINSIKEAEKVLGKLDIFDSIRESIVDSKQYIDALNLIKYKFELEVMHMGSSQPLWNTLGGKWFYRFYDMLEVEYQSMVYRIEANTYIWPSIIFRLMDNKVRMTPSAKVITNCIIEQTGRYIYIGEDNQMYKTWSLALHHGESLAISFIGMQGSHQLDNNKNQTVEFNLIDETEKRDLIHIIGEHSNNQMSILFLEDEIFLEVMDVTYETGNTIKDIPGAKYDAIVTYPQVSVLESLGQFNLE